jgi:hypothetical protein
MVKEVLHRIAPWMRIHGLAFLSFTTLFLLDGWTTARGQTYTSQICGSGYNNIPDAILDGSGNIIPGSLSCVIQVIGCGQIRLVTQLPCRCWDCSMRPRAI